MNAHTILNNMNYFALVAVATTNNKIKLKHFLHHCTAHLDKIISKQLNSIIHHPRFQNLEASWRGLHALANRTRDRSNKKIKIRILNISWQALAKDLLRAIEFDQSTIFNKIYSQEFDNPGGEPFGLLIGDYQIGHKTNYAGIASDLKVLELLAKVAGAAFVPFIANVDPSMFGIDGFIDLQPSLDLERLFRQEEYREWKKFRQDEEARFIGLVLPKVLARRPYSRQAYTQALGFCFTEEHCSHENYLWGNAVYCFASVITRSFEQNGWFINICGVEQNKEQGGIVANLTRDFFATDHTAKNATNIRIADKQEKILSEFGFIPLCECKYTPFNAFYSCCSVQQAKTYSNKIASNNAKISAMLSFVLCVSRFAHYIKILMRNKIGSFFTPEDCEAYLSKWILQYTANGEGLTPEFKAKYPLRAAKIKVREQINKTGNYMCLIHLQPHSQYEQIESKLQLLMTL